MGNTWYYRRPTFSGIEDRIRPKPQFIQRDQATYSKAPQVHHVKINSQNQLVILGHTNHRVDNLMFSSHIYLIKNVLFFYDHFIILTETGVVWVCGSNEHGKIGLGAVTRTNTVEQLDLPPIARISSDGELCIMYSETGECYTMGTDTTWINTSDISGRPRRQQNLDHYLQVIRRDGVYVLDAFGRVYRLSGPNLSEKNKIAKHVTRMSAESRCIIMYGKRNYIALITDPANQQPVKHDWENEELVASESCGYATFYANANGELKIRGDIAKLRANQQDWSRAKADDEDFAIVESMIGKHVTHITCGKNHAVFVDYQGNETSVFGVGSNFSGQLGLPSDVEEVHVPTEMKWKNMFPDGMHYFSSWGIQAVGCSQHNTYLWLSKLFYTCYLHYSYER